MRSNAEGSRALVLCAGGGIGDSLLGSVVGRALHQRFACVEALTLPAHRGTLERVPDYDGVLTDGGNEDELVAAITERGYAAAIVTWATARIARIARRARVPVRIGQARRLYSRSFTKSVVVRSERGDVTSHWTQVLLDYARALGCDTQDSRPRFVPTAQDEEEARAVLTQRGLGSGGFLILHSANAQATKRDGWPALGWARLAWALYERFGLPVALTGSEQEEPIVERIVAAAPRAQDGTVISLAGLLSIGAFGALARHARAFVGITTGVMHVAAAAGSPTVGIFPFQSDFPERWAPLGARTEIVRPSFCCHPGDTKERCTDYACIEHLDVPRILAATEALLR